MNRHLLLDRTLHALKTDAKLVFQQFPNGAHTTVTEVVNVVRLILRRVLTHLQEVSYDLVEVFGRKQRIVNAIAFRLAHLDVELQTAYAREIKLARVEEHRLEQLVSSLHSRRIARTHLAINLEQRIDWFGNNVFLQCLRQDGSNIVALREEHREAVDAALSNFLHFGRRDLVVSFEDYFTTVFIDDVGNRISAFKLRAFDFDFFNLRFAQTFQTSVGNFLAGANNRLRSTTFNVEVDLHPDEVS